MNDFIEIERNLNELDDFSFNLSLSSLTSF